jgi:hypothetical protein
MINRAPSLELQSSACVSPSAETICGNPTRSATDGPARQAKIAGPCLKPCFRRLSTLLALLRGLMSAFPPVAVLLVRTTPAFEPRAELVASLARLLRFGTIARAALALRVHGKPPLNERRLRVGRISKAEDVQRERDRNADPPRPPPLAYSSPGGGKRIVDCPHHARNIGCASALQALRWLASMIHWAPTEGWTAFRQPKHIRILRRSNKFPCPPSDAG